MSQQFSSSLASLQKLIDSNQDQATAVIDALISEGSDHQNQAWASHMTPSVNQSALLGQLLAGLHNGNLLSAELYPQLSAIEAQLLDWFCQLFGQEHGHFTHGSSYGNLEALWQAREKSNKDSNIVYGSEAAHYSIIKACQILGLKFQAIATNKLGQIDTEKLYEACTDQAPVAIVATAGTTSSGAIDPILACINIAREFNCWCHIDAAWGGALILIPEQKYLVGIEKADSVCFDPHKALGQPRPCSILLYQQALNLMTGIEVDYLIHPPKQTLAGSYGGELFLPLWFSLLDGGETLLTQLQSRLEQAESFAIALKKNTNWQVFHSPSGIVCFQASRDLSLAELEEQGLLSRSKINGKTVWRTVFASEATIAKALLTELEPYF